MSNDTAYCHHCGGDQDVQHYATIHPPGAESFNVRYCALCREDLIIQQRLRGE